MNYTQSSGKTYFNNLEALRFFAFLSVFISHIALFLGYESGSPYFSFIKKLFLVHGDLGVNFFFVLSGFLITYLLFSEKDQLGRISLFRFYLRRILRIWPLYILILVLGLLVVYPIALNSGVNFPFLTAESYSSLPWYIFFGANMKLAFVGAGSAVLAVLWAISVEGQFYILWPVIISFFSKENFIRIIFFIIGVSFLYRFYHYNNYNIVKYSTFSVMSDLAIGALGAYITLYFSRAYQAIQNCPKYIIATIYLFGFILIPLRTMLPTFSYGHVYQFLYSFEPILFSIFFTFIILEQNLSNNSFVKFGRFKVFNYLGGLSYGLYCYHMIAIFFTFYVFHLLGVPDVNHSFGLYLGEIVLSFSLAVVFSKISFYFFEKRFLSLKDRYGYKHTSKV